MEHSHEHHDMHSHDANHAGGHSRHAGHHTADFMKRFVICMVLTVPILLLSKMMQQWTGMALQFAGDQYLLAALASFVFIYGGQPFLKGLYNEVKSRSIGMMTLIGIAISVSWAYSLAIVFGLKGTDFFWEMTSLVDIMLIGHYVEMKSVMGASHSLELLASMLPATAHHIANGHVHDMPVSQLKAGQDILVKPGEKMPVDGIVTEGESHLDESMLTGESKPVKKQKGSRVIGGSINGNGSLTVKITGTGKDGYLNKVVKLVEDAQKVKSKTQNFADRAARVLTFIAIGSGFLTLTAWLLMGFSFVFALERMVSVMVICCPHALGLAIPLTVAISTSVSAQKGLLIHNRTAFENARLITTVLFDKTGTLTKGTHELEKTVVLDTQFDERELLRLAASIEQNSEHYIARGILKKANALLSSVPRAEKFNYLPGKGVEGITEGKEIKVVGPNYLEEKNIAIPGDAKEAAQTIVYILLKERIIGYFCFADQVRDSSYEAIRSLKAKGIKNRLLTGDNELVAKKVSSELHMDGFMANVLPHEKLAEVKKLQEQGEFVAMTGDGVNDAPALAQADVGIAIGSGTDVAAATADIILVRSDPKDIASLVLFGRATYKKMIQNLWWAAGYNIIAVPLAAGVLYKWGIMISPAAGAILMSLSTIVVAINAQLLKRQLI